MTDVNGGAATPVRKANPLRSTAFRKSPEHIKAVEHVQSWTRQQFSLTPDAPILVSQLTCTNEGCPPLQTVVAFWTESGERHHFKVLKPVESIEADDIPREWTDDALFTDGVGGLGAGCC
jgi:hypothetical protein